MNTSMSPDTQFTTTSDFWPFGLMSTPAPERTLMVAPPLMLKLELVPLANMRTPTHLPVLVTDPVPVRLPAL